MVDEGEDGLGAEVLVIVDMLLGVAVKEVERFLVLLAELLIIEAAGV